MYTLLDYYIGIAKKVTRAAGMDIEEELLQHFQQKMAPNILNLQAGDARNSAIGPSASLPSASLPSASIPSASLPAVKSLDELGSEIVKCCASLKIYQVIISSYHK